MAVALSSSVASTQDSGFAGILLLGIAWLNLYLAFGRYEDYKAQSNDN